MHQNRLQNEIGKGREDNTMIFILIHSSSRATSSPLHNNAKISTKITSLHTQTHSRTILNPTRLPLPLMQHHTT